MHKLSYLAAVVLLLSCGLSPDYQEVMVNKTVKVYSKEYHAEAENYTFKWKPIIGPTKKPVAFDLKNDMLIFSPIMEGNYQIHLSITDISNEVIAEEVFFYRAVAETLEVAIAPAEPETPQEQISTIVKKPAKKAPIKKESKLKTRPPSKAKKKSTKQPKPDNVEYTIQIAAWPSLELARKDQLQLIEEGFDAYIQRHYRKEKDAVWYRVRVGNFRNKNTAVEIQNDINSILGIKSWLDVVSTETN